MAKTAKPTFEQIFNVVHMHTNRMRQATKEAFAERAGPVRQHELEAEVYAETRKQLATLGLDNLIDWAGTPGDAN